MSLSARSNRLIWYLNRLRSMSVPEVAYRAQERAKRTVSQVLRPDFNAAFRPDSVLPVFPGLADGIQRIGAVADVVDRWAEIAEQARTGRLVFLGQEWPGVAGPEKWHLDPVTGRSWPKDRYCFSIPYRHADGYGDVKYVWEQNRLQHLQPIAALAAVTADAGYRRYCVEEIDCWIENNPPFLGVNWVNGIELALRAVSIAVVAALVGEDAFTDRQKQRIIASLAAHGYWLMRYPSRFSSANNHLIAEAAGLYLLGRLAPGVDGAERYADYGRRVLCHEALLQIHGDGVGAEQSPTYTACTLEWLLLCREVGRQSGNPFPEAFDRRLIEAGRFLRWITDSAGRQPRLGDDDEGRVLFAGEESGYVASILGCLASALGDADLAPPGVTEHLRNGFFGSSPEPAEPPLGARTFAEGGYSVLRWKIRDVDGLWVFDHGPLGYLSIAAHGHADGLAIWLHLGGQPVLVDAGTYLYHAGGAWRDHFRGTMAHNTLTIDTVNSSEITGAFNWGRKAGAALLSHRDAPETWRVEAEHDGYVEPFGVRHRRRMERTSENVFTITDSLEGAGGSYDVDVGFLVHPDLAVSEADGVWTVDIDPRSSLEIRHLGPLSGAVRQGEEAPPKGWYSSQFGSKQPAPRLGFSGRLSTGEPCTTTLTVVARS